METLNKYLKIPSFKIIFPLLMTPKSELLICFKEKKRQYLVIRSHLKASTTNCYFKQVPHSLNGPPVLLLYSKGKNPFFSLSEILWGTNDKYFCKTCFASEVLNIQCSFNQKENQIIAILVRRKKINAIPSIALYKSK